MRAEFRLIVLLGLALSGCAVGPDVEPQQPALPAAFANAGDADADIEPASLWVSLGDPVLVELIGRASEQNLDIAQALATLNETRSLANLQVYSLFPTVTITGEQERLTESGRDPFAFGAGGAVERYRAGFDAVWEIDLFGSLRRQAEQIGYVEAADAATLYSVRIAVIAEVAQSYFEWLGESLRLGLLQRNIDIQRERIAIIDASLQAGRGTVLDLARARAEERSLSAELPEAERSVERALQRLAVLTRQTAETLRPLLGEASSRPTLPPMLAVGEPSDWLLRRPDVLAAERRLASATADVGVQTAEYFPKLTLIGDFGWLGDDSDAIGDSNAERWRVAPSLSWRLPDFGRIRQRVGAAKARLDGAYALYEQTWRLALEETENALLGYRASTRRVRFLEEAVSAAQEASDLAVLRYEAGADSYLSVLDAERTRIDLEDQLAFARTGRATSLAALYKALGGDFAEAAVGP